MSADNWTICPKCKLAFEVEQQRQSENLNKSYGRLPVDEWLARRDKIKVVPSVQDTTLREDYEIGTDEDGTFSISYSCSCACGFSWKYKHSEDVQKKGA